MNEVNKQLTIAVAGTGYVGLSIATLLSQHHHVLAVDVVQEKVDKINRRESPISDEYIEKFFAERELDLQATLNGEEAYRQARIVVIATPTNYDPVKNFFDTTHVEEVITGDAREPTGGNGDKEHGACGIYGKRATALSL